MAETVHLYLKANGQAINGDSTQHSLGRENSIECIFYEQKVLTAREAGSGMATGRRQYEPIVIRKRIDKSKPLKWLVRNRQRSGIQTRYEAEKAKADATPATAAPP